VLGLCRLLTRHREEAEDAVQQTFLSAYRSLLNGVEPRHPAAWLATIARNECRERIEQRMREPLGDAESESTLPDPVAAAAASADLIALWQAIAELPRRQRKALLLREFSGLSYRELASALAVSEPTVQSLLFRARRELRARLRPVSGSLGSVAPLVAIREAIARSIGGMPDPSAGLAGFASASLVTKLAAGAAVVVFAGGTVAAIETGSVERATPVADAATIPMPDPVAPPALTVTRPTHVAFRGTSRKKKPVRAGNVSVSATAVRSAATPVPPQTPPESGAEQAAPPPAGAPAQAGPAPVVSPDLIAPASSSPPAEQRSASSDGGSTDNGGSGDIQSSSSADDGSGSSGSSEVSEVTDGSSDSSGSSDSGAQGAGGESSSSGSGSDTASATNDGGGDQTAASGGGGERSSSGSGGSGADGGSDGVADDGG
jgi:RNA polymerase sigma-70 factor (ECF subfamily)